MDCTNGAGTIDSMEEGGALDCRNRGSALDCMNGGGAWMEPAPWTGRTEPLSWTRRPELAGIKKLARRDYLDARGPLILAGISDWEHTGAVKMWFGFTSIRTSDGRCFH